MGDENFVTITEIMPTSNIGKKNVEIWWVNEKERDITTYSVQ